MQNLNDDFDLILGNLPDDQASRSLGASAPWSDSSVMSEPRPVKTAGQDEMLGRMNELAVNPQPRVPVCLCLDVSASMQGDKLAELKTGLARFFDAVRSDPSARTRADISVITFGERVERVVDFGSVDRQEAPKLVANGLTPMGEAVALALDSLEGRKREYKACGREYFQPWLVLMTDGDHSDDVAAATTRMQTLVHAKTLTVIPVAIGADADLEKLAAFSPARPPLRLKGLAFAEFFAWLGDSVKKVSESRPGDKMSLPSVDAWASIDA